MAGLAGLGPFRADIRVTLAIFGLVSGSFVPRLSASHLVAAAKAEEDSF